MADGLVSQPKGEEHVPSPQHESPTSQQPQPLPHIAVEPPINSLGAEKPDESLNASDLNDTETEQELDGGEGDSTESTKDKLHLNLQLTQSQNGSHSQEGLLTPTTASTTPDSSPAASPRTPVEFKDRFVERRDKIALEILTTERKYVVVLQFVMDEYLVPLRKLAEKKSEAVVPAKKIPDMFSKLEDLHKINFQLLARLEEAIGRNWSPTQCIGHIFLEMVPQLNMYMEYVAHHKTSILTVSKFGKKAPFISFCEAIKAKTEGPMEARRLDLLGLLIQPVQRIPRYQMLLEDLRKRSAEDHPDYQNLVQAVAEITRIANEVDAQMDKEENFLKMYKIQASFIGNVKCLVKEGRVFVREGPLIKICRKVPKKRWFFLFNDALVYGSLVGADKVEKASVYTREASTGSNKYTFHRLIQFGSGRQGEKNRDTFKVRDIPDSGDEKYAFQIISSEKSFTVYGRSQEEKEAWMTDLRQQLAAFAPEGVLPSEDEGAPVWIPDHKANDCQTCSIPFTVIRRRHHCRNCGKVVCGSCSSKRVRLSKLRTEKPVRVCTFCYSWIQSKEGAGADEDQDPEAGAQDETPRDDADADEGEGDDKEKEKEKEKEKKAKKKPSSKRKEKERKRDKLGTLLSWRSDDHKRPVSGKSPRSTMEGLFFEPVELVPSPPPSSEGKSSGELPPTEAAAEGSGPAQPTVDESGERLPTTTTTTAAAAAAADKKADHSRSTENCSPPQPTSEQQDEKPKQANSEAASARTPLASSSSATAAQPAPERTKSSPRRAGQDWQQGHLSVRMSASPVLSLLGSANPSTSPLAAPALNRASFRQHRMSIGVERAKLHMGIALEAAKAAATLED